MLKSVSRLSASVRLLTGQRVHSLSSGGVCFIGSRRTTVRQPPPSREAVNAPAGDVDAATRLIATIASRVLKSLSSEVSVVETDGQQHKFPRRKADEHDLRAT